MIRTIAALIFIVVSSTTYAGVIGIGGTNARENPELMSAINKARRFETSHDQFRRLSVRVDSGQRHQEVISTSGERVRRDFVRVYVDHHSKIVDSNVELDVQPHY